MALQRHPETQHVGEHRGMSGCTHRDLSGRDVAECGADTSHAVAVRDEPRHLATLKEIHARRVGSARETPSDVIVFGDSSAWLIGRTEHRVAQIGRNVDDWAELLDLV